jgi:CRISPR-associated endonuclease/helicase Cas3
MCGTRGISFGPGRATSCNPSMNDRGVFAHSVANCRDVADWEPLGDHLERVGDRAAQFAAPFSAGELARVAGLLHDIGKCSAEYQAYIRGERTKGPDHSTAGARAAVAHYGPLVGRLLAFAIAGHHSGLMDGSGDHGRGHSLSDRLDAPTYSIPTYENWLQHLTALPSLSELQPDRLPHASTECPGFERAFLIRMLFSCLVDADFLETERFYATADGMPVPARGGVLQQTHLEQIRTHMTGRRRTDTPLNRLRTEIGDHVIARATLPPGLFTLTVPTGGGKTLTSLSFALEHARTYGLRRVVYVIPFTSIIEQTAQVFREVFGEQNVLEHHCNFDWDQHEPSSEEDGEVEGAGGLAKLRRDAENWDAPIVVTTAVQFFESLFAARTSRVRKLHNLARSVIVLDEAQTLPLPLLRPCMAALDELARNYGASVVLCTATQPALRKCDNALPRAETQTTTQGFDVTDDRELAPRPRELYTQLKRVQVEWRRDPVADAEIVARFTTQAQMLCIVNTRAHARALFDAIAHLPGVRHLTTLMCAKHRRDVLSRMLEDLELGQPVRLVATSLIEAGVDIDFPEVWRAAAGLDSIAQAAGRCNREGELEGLGRTVVFEPADRKLPAVFASFYQPARHVLRAGGDPLALDAVHRYFRELYFQRGYEALDAATLDGMRYPILPEIERTRTHLDFPFSRIAQAFRLIDDIMVPVLIPWDDRARAALRDLTHAPVPPPAVVRRLQQYVVSIPKQNRAALLASGAVRAIRAEIYGDRFLYLASPSLYSPDCGLWLDDPTWRSSESNVW